MINKKTGIWIKLGITLVFVSGALIFMYPFVANLINTQIDQFRIEEMEKKQTLDKKSQIAKKEAREEEIAKNPYLGMSLEDELYAEVGQSGRLSSKDIKEHLIGSISIPKINSELPIFDVTNSSFLQEGITLLPGASYPTGGEGTHSVLTGHTGLSDKKLFTDLKELTEGDVFYIKVLGETIAYKVDQIKIVLPNELDDLAIIEDKDYVTLITCTPYMINTHRLLVRGERTEINYQAIEKEKKKINSKNKLSLFLFGIIILLLMILVIYVAYRQFINYQIMKKDYRLDFNLLHNNKPKANNTFLVLDKTSKQPIVKNSRKLVIKSNPKGRIIYRLKGGKYWLVQQGEIENPLTIECWVSGSKEKYFKVKLMGDDSNGWTIKTQKRKKK